MRPMVPWRCGVRREVLGYGSVEEVRPRATAITFVLPKKRLGGAARQVSVLLLSLEEGSRVWVGILPAIS